MRLLVPTDFSDNALHAAKYALTLANVQAGSNIHLVHVLTPILNDTLLIRDVEEEAAKSLAEITNELKRNGQSCSITNSIRIGETVAEINKAAKDFNAGMVVMGVQGLGKTSRFLFGSNTSSLINQATCPVWVLPERAAVAPPEKIVFATDYYDSDLEALQRLIPIANAFHSEIIVVHIFDENDEEQSEVNMIKFIADEIFKTIEYSRLIYRVYYNKDTVAGLKNFCEFTGADLLVVSARKKNIFQKLFDKSITKELVYESEVPLLVFHVHKTEDIGIF